MMRKVSVLSPHSTTVSRFFTMGALAILLLVLPEVAEPKGSIKVGDPFPHFTGIDMDGNTVDTKDFANKTILLDFWSIYCAACVEELPHLIRLQNTYHDQGLVVIGIDLDVFGPERIQKWMRKKGFDFPYPNIIDSKMKIKKLLGISILPTTVLADPGGTVRFFHIGYKKGDEIELEEVIRKYLPDSREP